MTTVNATVTLRGGPGEMHIKVVTVNMGSDIFGRPRSCRVIIDKILCVVHLSDNDGVVE